jgi:hypothetical protein
LKPFDLWVILSSLGRETMGIPPYKQFWIFPRIPGTFYSGDALLQLQARNNEPASMNEHREEITIMRTKNGLIALLTFVLMFLMVACTTATPGGTGDVAAPTPEATADCPDSNVRGTPVPLESAGNTADCPPIPEDVTEGTPVITGPITDTTDGTESGNVGDMEIEWNPSPEEVIAQYSIFGGFRMRPSATELPQWTLYGDGTVVWTMDGDPTTGFTNQVMIGKLSESEMRDLLSAINESGFWELDDRYSDDMIADAASAGIIINLSNQAKQVVVYPAGREDTPAAFNAVMDLLLQTKPADSAEVEPTEFTLTAEFLGNIAEMPADAQPSYIDWTVDGVVLADSVTGQSLTAEQAEAVQAFINENGTIVAEDGVGYNIRLEANPPRPLQEFTLS